MRPHSRRSLRHLGIVVPVHNEEILLPRALQALDEALSGVPRAVECRVALVIDASSDASSDIARAWGASRKDACVLLRLDANVGAARRAGCDALLSSWGHTKLRQSWLATTDADSEVPRDWLTAQIAAREAGADLWTGRVAVTDWQDHDPETVRAWAAAYEAESDPVHGTNMGLAAELYARIGGFRPLRTGEDRDLYARALATGATRCHQPEVRVRTSARRVARAPQGFAHALVSLEGDLTLSA
jgi:glycosyltransferase involved in cell wall biosynthesis